MSHCISYLLVNKYVCVCVCVFRQLENGHDILQSVVSRVHSYKKIADIRFFYDPAVIIKAETASSETYIIPWTI